MRNNQETITDIVTVEATKPPYGTAKNGILTASNGKAYRAPPNMLGILRIGGTYQVTYFLNDFNGQTYNMVTAIKQINQQDNVVVAGSVPTARNYVPVVQTSEKAVYHPDTQLSIYVCGGLNQAIAASQVNVMDVQSIAQATRNLMQAYKGTLGAPPGATTGTMAPKAVDPLGSGDMDGDSVTF